MDISGISPILLLASLMVASTPILLAALGELVVERAGVLNLGVARAAPEPGRDGLPGIAEPVAVRGLGQP